MNNIPTWLMELSLELRTQDNRCTSYPIYLVQQKKRTYGFDADYATEDEFEWIYEDEACAPDEYVQIALEAWYEAGGQENMPYRRMAYVDTYEFVQCFFTNKAAAEYISANKHRLCEPIIYVDSGYRNKQWIQMREWILELADPDKVANNTTK